MVLPFQWSLIDAFHYLPHFASRREAALGRPDPLPPTDLRGRVGDALTRIAARGGFLSLLFHPFLLDTDERRAAAREVLSDVRGLAEAGAIQCAPLREIAGWN